VRSVPALVTPRAVIEARAAVGIQAVVRGMSVRSRARRSS